MSIRKFSEEFTHLVRRWTRSPVLSRDGAEILVPLTKRELVNTIKIVMQMTLGVHLHETTQAEIAASRPSSFPESFRYRSLDDLLPSSDSSDVKRVDPLSSKSPYKKLISQSSPTIHVSFLDRHEASIRAQAEMDALYKQQMGNVRNILLLNRLNVLKMCANDVMAKIDGLRKEIYPQTRIPSLRVPPNAAPPELSGSSSLLRKVPRPILRKPSSGFSGTSATTKLYPTVTIEKEKASALPRAIARSSKSKKPLEMLPRSPLPSVAGSSTKKSTPSTLTTAKTPKSASIRSTISKFASCRKS